jgi:hypothetical protein
MLTRSHGGRAWRRRSLLYAAALLVLAATVPSASFAVADIREAGGDDVADFDARRGSVPPSARQRAVVRALHASATWNRFGTPQSLIRYGGQLALGVRGETAVAAARNWLSANRALFRLRSTAGLELQLSNPLGRRARALTFRHRIGGLPAAEGGLVNVAVVKAKRGWNISYVASTITPDVSLLGPVRLSAREAMGAGGTERGPQGLDP